MSAARYLTSDEKLRLLSELPSARDRLLVVLGANTGLRISELLSLAVGQVWRDGSPSAVLQVARRHLKGGRGARKRHVLSRRIPLNAAASTALSDYIIGRFGLRAPPPDAVLFKSQRHPHRAIGRLQAYLILREAAARAGLEGPVAPHSLRRTFAGDVYELTGHDLVATQKLLGHSSPVVTANYLRPGQDKLDQVVMALGEGPVLHVVPARTSA